MGRTVCSHVSVQQHPRTLKGAVAVVHPFCGTQAGTLVYALYCDGGSWAGDATEPVVARVKRLSDHDAVLPWSKASRCTPRLAAGTRLSDATELLYAGCSAGGLTAYMHADYVAAKMPASVKTVAMADAMFSIDTADFHGERVEPDMLAWVYTAMICSASVNQGCLAAQPQWHCLHVWCKHGTAR